MARRRAKTARGAAPPDRRDRREALEELRRALAETLDPAIVAQRTVESVRVLLGTRNAALYRIADDGTLDSIAFTGDAPTDEPKRLLFPRGTGAIGLAMRTRRPVASPNVLADHRIRLTSEMRRRIERLGYRSVLVAPLIAKDVVVGGLSVGDVEGRRFTADEIRLMATFASAAALALDNAQLYRAARQSEEQYRNLFDEAQASEERYRSLVEGSFQGIHIHRGWITLFANTAFARMLGYDDPRALIGKDSRQWIAPHALPTLEAFNAARLRGEPAPGEYEFQALRRDGTPFWVQVVPSLIHWEGEPAIQSAIIDVTARREGEAALRASELRYRQLVEGSLQGMWVHRDFLILFANTIIARIFGYDDARALIGRDSRDFFPPEEQARREAYASARLRGEPAPARYEVQAIHRDGSRIWLETSAVRIAWDGDSAIQATFVDITERKRAEALVRESAEFSRQVVSSAGEGIVVYDRDLRYLLWNTFMERLTGLPAAEVVGRPALELFPHLREQGVEALLRRALAGETVNSPDVPYHVPSTGRSGWVAGRYGPLLDAHGQVVGVIGMVSDVGERKRTEAELVQKEAELRQSQKMDAVGRLAGGVAHDFNNLLTVIAGRAELLLRRMPPGEPTSLDIELIQKTSQRAATLTRQLLAFSRKQVLQPKILDLNAIVAQMAQMLERLIGENIELVTSLDPALGRVKADPSQIEQIVLNLAVNARDALPRGGRLAIRTADTLLDDTFVQEHPGARTGPHALLEVSDNGIGISAPDLQHIFEPFFTTKGVGHGTGLGLATVYGIVKQHSGWIGVESEVERGTTFRIYLPRVEEATPVLDAGLDETGAPRSSGTVLLVEDEPDVRALAREMLAEAGYTVLEAGSPQEALAACRGHAGRIHLLLTDVVMPQMTGYDLAARVADLRPETKRIYMSGYSEDALRHHGTVDPDARLLQKPFTADLLTRVVYQVLHADARV